VTGALVFVLTMLAIPSAAACAQDAAPIVVARDVKISMRLGPALRARVYRPGGTALRAAILSIESDTSAERDRASRALAAAGYAVVIAEPRGGDDKHVGRDGYDAIEWIGDQPWSDRKVVMIGAGEGANAAWNAAREHPPYLNSIVTRAPARPVTWTDAEYRRVSLPALIIAGPMGEPQGAAVEAFARYAEAGGGTHVEFVVIGALKPSQLEDVEEQWCAWTFGRGSPPPMLRKRVNYMFMTDSSWRAADSFAAIGAVPTGYPLHTDAGPRTLPGGFLGGSARDDEPADTVAASGKTYETLVNTPVDLIGQPTVTLWLSHAVEKGLQVALDEVRPDSTVAPLGTSAGHFKPVDSTSVQGKGPGRWEFDAFPWIATRIAGGAKIRLTVRGGETVVVYHDTDRYSRLMLPEVKGQK
jgi:X-Pro dipeptidyl-peptidase (S15 family)